MAALETHIGTRLMLHFALDVAGVHRIEVCARVDNQRSSMALGRRGARREGTLRAAFVCDGKYADQHLGAIARGFEWVRPGSVEGGSRD